MTTGADLYALASRFAGLPYRLGSEVNKYSVDYIIQNRIPLDCSELVERTCDALGVRPTMVDGAYNQKQFCRANHTITTVDRAIHTRGALLGIDRGAGAVNHIAFSDGNGGTMEAANRHAGCGHFRSAGRFNWGGLVPGVNYGVNTPSLPPVVQKPPTTITLPGRQTIQRGARGHLVECLVWELVAISGAAVDGNAFFGSKTEEAVKNFQRFFKLQVDGVAGPKTWRTLDLVYSKKFGQPVT
jgi:N-acetylmuramoyl-L-alanine amidase